MWERAPRLLEGRTKELATHIAHDFFQYGPSRNRLGLPNSDWEYHTPNFDCDTTKVPYAARYDVAPCTEVLQHVPCPVFGP